MGQVIVVPSRVSAESLQDQLKQTSARVSASANDLDALLGYFSGPSWPEVKRAATLLENHQAAVIPALLRMLEDNRKVELIDTFDLIYPGAKQFFGHGGILNYDIDWLPDRAGWLLEDLTFENFGFEVPALSALKHWTIQDRVQTKIQGAEDEGDERRRREHSRLAVKRAEDWWEQSKNDWSRLNALVDVLESNDPIRQALALQWLRLGETTCDGLTKAFYQVKIRPLVVRLTNSDHEDIKDNAKLLLGDIEYYWLSR